MKDWWKKKKSKMRKNNKSKEAYNFGDFMLDMLLWLPELIVFPIRVIYWVLRALSKNIFDTF
ncbi:hypothetical protein [Piscibacillus salipiscarius]|uniref:Uncharacterized protein n=1 Tax=Piscibacillus salipiscarius TaxID=299480 RepID=A0ABW5Q8L3_9BACI